MKEKSFEEKQEQLEAIVAQLETGNVPLAEMISLYEQGEALYRECVQTLDAYEKRLNESENRYIYSLLFLLQPFLVLCLLHMHLAWKDD